MGNSNTSEFDSGEAILYTGNHHWILHKGFRKENKEEVAIFKYLKNQKDALIPAQRAVQKMKTLRHPHVLSYVGSAEYDDSLMLVTEGCIPVGIWLQDAARNLKINSDNTESFQQELLWGIKCILEALQFLHNNGFAHNYLGLHAIFVANNGDWKIGALDLLGTMTAEDDFNFMKIHAKLLDKPYIAPERQQTLVFTSEAEKSSKVAVGSAADVFALAHCVQNCYALANLTVPEGLSKYFARMLSVDQKRRPTASQLAKCPVFTSENIKLMSSLGDLAALKPASETLEALNQLSEKVAILPTSICVFKILPCLARTLQMASTDFNNRDSREACRQSIQLCLSMLSRLADHNKITEEEYVRVCLNSVLALWTMTDRTIRTALLSTLKSLVALTPADMVNKSIFDPLLAGFQDSNAKMREETLKCLVHVVEKLDEKHLQDILVRCITKLQNDTENSIRTNATIFLGRIAVKLKEGVRVRVLCVSFAKAMRDGFVHCRAAGLKAAIACLSLLDHSQLTSKLLPQVCSLLLDRSAEVRELSLKLLDLGLAVMKDQHKVLCIAEKNAAVALAASGESGKNTAAEKESSAWGTSWSSLSLTLEKIAVGGTAAATTTSASTAPMAAASSSSSSSTSLASDIHKTQSVKEKEKEKEKEKIITNSTIPKTSKIEASVTVPHNKIDDMSIQTGAVRECWGGDTSFNDWDNVDTVDTSTSYGQINEPSSSSGGWGDDDDLDLDESNDRSASGSSTPHHTPDKSVKAVKTPGGLSSSSPKTKSVSDSSGKLSSIKAKKAVSAGPSKRLSIGAESSDNWDDF